LKRAGSARDDLETVRTRPAESSPFGSKFVKRLNMTQRAITSDAMKRILTLTINPAIDASCSVETVPSPVALMGRVCHERERAG
jgi:hypothetical protein